MPNKKTGHLKNCRDITIGVRVNADEQKRMELRAIKYGYYYLAEFVRDVALRGVFEKE